MLTSVRSENQIKHTTRAVYVPSSDGYRLARIQQFSRPFFRESGYERLDDAKDFDMLPTPFEPDKSARSGSPDPDDVERAVRRAKTVAFDAILCNPDLNTFCTLTFDPRRVGDRCDYDELYRRHLCPWLSNRVQRHDLKYIAVPERHKSGAIHMHMIANSDALSLVPAISPTGKALTHRGNPLYNIDDWRAGFTSAEKIAASDGDREAVAKYIFKYMGKQAGQKIGGRYFLSGGKLDEPRVVYGESPEEFFPGISTGFSTGSCKHESVCEPVPGITYREWSYI